MRSAIAWAWLAVQFAWFLAWNLFVVPRILLILFQISQHPEGDRE